MESVILVFQAAKNLIWGDARLLSSAHESGHRTAPTAG